MLKHIALDEDCKQNQNRLPLIKTFDRLPLMKTELTSLDEDFEQIALDEALN